VLLPVRRWTLDVTRPLQTVISLVILLIGMGFEFIRSWRAYGSGSQSPGEAPPRDRPAGQRRGAEGVSEGPAR